MYISTTKRGLTKEIKIPLPHGHLAAKTWGSPTNSPVLCIHGWMDNANTFDKLIPLLPTDFYYVCIDLIGNGMSSHIPKGITYTHVYSIGVIYHTLKYFGWTVCSLMGHSLGGFLSMRFAYSFPKCVDKVILLDSAGYWISRPKVLIQRNRKFIESQLKLESYDHKDFSISFSTASNRLLKACPDIGTAEAEILLERGLKKTSGGEYMFNMDYKSKYYIHYFYCCTQSNWHLASVVEAEVLQLLSNQRKGIHFKQITQSEFKDEILFCFKGLKYDKQEIIEGNHYVHLLEPEKVAGHITEMFKRPPRKDIKPLKLFHSKI